jgi:hypothetical protein
VRYASRLQHYLALKNEIFISTDRAFLQKRSDFHYGTARANAFTGIDFSFKIIGGTVRAFEINQLKR